MSTDDTATEFSNLIGHLKSRKDARMTRKLPQSFYQRDTATVALELLGQHLVRVLPDGTRLSGLIVETEAYIGATDRACHGYGYRRTKRTESLFQDGGFSYVYLIYGMYDCFNIVTQSESEPEAVLIRALEPLEGIEQMRRHRPVKRDLDLTNGPGKLCRALRIDRSLDRLSLLGETIFVESSSPRPSENEIIRCPRIGVEYAGEAAHWPLRFILQQSRYISVRP